MPGLPPEIFGSTLELLEELAAISSPSGDLAGIAAVERRYGAALERHGLAVEIADEPGAGGAPAPVLTARGPAARNRHLLVIGHLDTVLPAVPPRRRGGRLEATGAVDMKGGLAAFAGALELLAHQGRRIPDDVLVVVVPDEEIVGPLTRAKVETLGPGARALWSLEPGQLRGEGDDERETIVIGRRGMFHWHLEVHGRAAHAGNGYWQGRSALTAAADWCLRARALAVPGPGPTINAGRLVAGEAGFVADLARGADVVGTARQLNVVPDRARVEGEARFLDRSEGERLAEELAEAARTVAREHEVEATFHPRSIVPPLVPSTASRRHAERAVALAERQGWRLEIEEDRPGLSFPNFLPPDAAPIPALDGLGPAGGGMHTREEYVDLASLERRIALLAELLWFAREPPPEP